MAGQLRVDVDGLRSAAASSSAVAAGLITGADTADVSRPHPSTAGVAAMDAAVTATANSYSGRITGQSDALTSGAQGYEEADTNGGQAITTVSM
ncbi:type VII secretion target [Mycolicibacterium mucogenicum]|uniref:type VII secretion target n=1 Tax=Mycolicibacterium mucogenicum TaxID=56689 RepID=UPI0022699C52|nr:type VII secretion target [Mycolicibacterium mucogenicum]MCX8557214.1 type VII secretion target [Mycolicibacterium mucogenicum]